MNEEYEKRQGNKPYQSSKPDHDTLGKVCKISCGSFDQNNKYEVADTWSFEGIHSIPQMSYYRRSRPKRFDMSLPTPPNSQNPIEQERMELVAPNIRGVIFESPQIDQPNRRTVYFVLDKPPRFFQGSKKDVDQAPGAVGIGRQACSRSMYPSIAARDGPCIFDVPWVIQFFRVFSTLR